jgi:hypothetical protein
MELPIWDIGIAYNVRFGIIRSKGIHNHWPENWKKRRTKAAKNNLQDSG